MIKTVKSLAHLHELALKHGATIEIDGRTINAAGAKVAPMAPAPKVSPAIPAQEPVRAGIPIEHVEALIRANDAKWEREVANLRSEMETLREQNEVTSAPVTDWKFDVEYNPDGSIKLVQAKAETMQ